MESKFRLADIIQYILLGFFVCSMGYFIFKDEVFAVWIPKIQKYETFINSLTFAISFFFLLLLYFLGIFIQGVKYCFGIHLYSQIKDILEKLNELSEKGKKQNRKTQKICEKFYFVVFKVLNVFLRPIYSFIFRNGSITEIALKLQKLAKKEKHNTPFWIIESENPSKTIFILAEYLRTEKKTYRADYYYNLCEFWQGINFSSLILGMISFGFFKRECVISSMVFFFITIFLSRTFAYRYIAMLNLSAIAAEIDMKEFIKKRFLEKKTVLSDGYFDYIIQNGKATISCYSGSNKNLIIPETLGGYEITSIGDRAFANCKSVQVLKIPNSITSIGNATFWNCKSLKNIEIPNSVTIIGEKAFQYCENLKSLEIPNSVINIGIGAFAWCKKLKMIVVTEGHPVYSFRGGVLFSENQKILHSYLPSNKMKLYKIPDFVTSIEDSAFRNSNKLKKLEISNSVTSIGKGAFKNSSIKMISIPNSVISIGERAFEDCDNLIVTLTEGSYTHKYAQENHIDFVLE